MKRMWLIQCRISKANKAAFALTKEELISKIAALCGHAERETSYERPPIFFPIYLIHQYSKHNNLAWVIMKQNDEEEEILITVSDLKQKGKHYPYAEEDVLVSLVLEHFNLIGISAIVHSKVENEKKLVEYKVINDYLQPQLNLIGLTP